MKNNKFDKENKNNKKNNKYYYYRRSSENSVDINSSEVNKNE